MREQFRFLWFFLYRFVTPNVPSIMHKLSLQYTHRIYSVRFLFPSQWVKMAASKASALKLYSFLFRTKNSIRVTYGTVFFHIYFPDNIISNLYCLRRKLGPLQRTEQYKCEFLDMFIGWKNDITTLKKKKGKKETVVVFFKWVALKDVTCKLLQFACIIQ